jgi:hypothetical protein
VPQAAQFEDSGVVLRACDVHHFGKGNPFRRSAFEEQEQLLTLVGFVRGPHLRGRIRSLAESCTGAKIRHDLYHGMHIRKYFYPVIEIMPVFP